MRTPLAALAASVLLACSSGTRIIYVPAPRPAPTTASAPAPAPAPRAVPVAPRPVAVSIVRVDEQRLLLRTNQPAYLAVFEIVPNRGVTVVYPASPRQRQLALSGSHWLNVSFGPERVDDDGNARDDRRCRSVHHLYAIASARPLRITDAAFDDVGLRTMLGSRAYRATDPAATMTALSRRFVATTVDEDWSDDVYTADMMRQRVLRPDTVVASNDRPARRRMDPASARVFRLPPSTDAGNGEPKNRGGESVADSRPSGDDGRPANDDSAERGKKAKDKQDDGKQNNGNHYGWDKRDKDEKANKEQKGNDDEKGSKDEKGNKEDKRDNANAEGNGTPPSEPLIRLQGKPEQPSHTQPSDRKPDATPDVKPESKPEAKPEAKPESKPEAKPDDKADKKPDEKADKKPDEKAAPAADTKSPTQETKSDSTSEDKHKKGKPDRLLR